MALNDAERKQLREALHKMNNALNSISMQAELAKLYADRNETAKIQEALEIIMSQCRQCSAVTQSTHGVVDDSGWFLP